jgi:predicted CXXCH cytochrome family protein
VKRALLVLLLAGCRPAMHAAAPVATPTVTHGQLVTSNVTRADYAGSRNCQPCHADLYADWLRSPMHNMTRQVADATLHAPFAGETWRFKKDAITFETHDGARFMRLDSATDGTHLYRVTKVIGGHHREDFVGVEVAQEAGLPPVNGIQRVLPATFMLGAQAWRYKGYSVMSPERPALRPGAVWQKTCIFCHNTEPYLSDLFGTLAGPSTPAYQGEVVDALLPAERRWSYRVTDEAAARRAVDAEVAFLGAKPGGASLADALGRAVKATRALFAENHLVEIGIGCESCHGGAAEHVRDPALRPSLSPRAPFLAVDTPSGKRSRADEINHLCARCHQVLFTQYPWTWEGERRNGAHPGGGQINSGEGRDLLLGGCAGEMSCVSCHDPHAHDNQAKMAVLDGNAGSQVCLRCHDKYAAPEAWRAHAHHDPASAGGACMSCHLPKKNLSLDNGLTRYHRIASPTETTKVEGDRPLECALCHADKTVDELVSTMERWWHKRYDRGKLTQLYGSLQANALRATLTMGKAHEQAVAMAVLGQARDRASAPLFALSLTHPIPIVRYYAERALEAALGAPLGIDLFRDDDAIRRDGEARLRAAGVQPIAIKATPPTGAPEPSSPMRSPSPSPSPSDVE